MSKNNQYSIVRIEHFKEKIHNLEKINASLLG
jgi:hypothetical protein